MFRPIAFLLFFIFSLFWALVGIVIDMGILESVIAAVIFGVLGFVIAFRTHLSGYEGLEI